MSEWLGFVQRIQAIAQIGLTYTDSEYDRERYEQLRDIAVEMGATYTASPPELIRDLYTRDPGYTTPKVDTRGACFRDGKILLVKEKQDGLWTLPGGWADVGDTPSEAVTREIYEESGFEARAIKLAALYDRHKHAHPAFPFYTYKMMFICEITGGAPRTNHETLEIGFFAPDAIPQLSVERVLPAHIQMMFRHYHHPDLPTEFD